MQKMAAQFAQWQMDPSDLLDPAFVGSPVMFEGVLSSACHEKPLLQTCFKTIFHELQTVTQRQLADFLTDGQFGQ